MTEPRAAAHGGVAPSEICHAASERGSPRLPEFAFFVFSATSARCATLPLIWNDVPLLQIGPSGLGAGRDSNRIELRRHTKFRAG